MTEHTKAPMQPDKQPLGGEELAEQIDRMKGAITFWIVCQKHVNWPESDYLDIAKAAYEALRSTRPQPVRDEVLEEALERAEKGREAVLELQRMMDGHYEVIRQFLDAEQGPGFAHRVNSVLLRMSGHFFQIGEKLRSIRVLKSTTPAPETTK